MTRGVRLNSLAITAFRGISDPVHFDLSAPLTLVFAPNGTGKTTMCEAAEWLLTGQVERLKDGKDFDAQVLRSKFAAADQAASVEANMFVAGVQRFLARQAEGAHSPAVSGPTRDDTARPGPHELLSLLAPAAAADEAHHLTAINLRQRWLKGTRFLSAEALAALVDTDEETIDRRTQVFADLLGIRHLLDAERQCEKYAGELRSRLRALKQLTEQQETEARDLTAVLAAGPNEAPARTISARSEAAAAATLLDEDGDEIGDDVSLDNRLEALTATHRRQRHAFDARSAAAQRVEAQWSARTSLVAAVSENSALEGQLAAELAQIEERGRAAAAALTERTSEREVADEDARKLAGAKDRLTHLGAVLLATLLDAGLLTGAPQSLASLSQALAEARWTDAAREARRQDLTALKASLEQSASAVERLRLIVADIARRAPERVSEEALAVLRSDAADADARARTARTALDATAEPVSRLQEAARDLLAHDHSGTSQCPACAHDWGNAAELRAAIAKALKAAPAIAASARAGADAASEAARGARTRLDTALSVEAAIAALEKERAALMAAAEQRGRDIARLGLPADRTLEEIASAQARLDVADTLAELIAARDGLLPALPGGPAPLLPPDTAVSGLLVQLEASFAAREQVVQLRLAELAKVIETATSERDALRATHAGTQQRLRECRETLRDKGAELAGLRGSWVDAAPDVAWSDVALAELKQQLATEANRLQRAEAHIEAARTAWAAESRRERLDALQKAIAPALERQQRMMDRIAAANRARAIFQEAYATTSRKQVQDLSRVVNPLFARMHANRVCDRINLGEDSAFLHWLADAGGEQLDPGKDFSQGQRQDLALALFLARARSLGGTFFLDEPVIHLDDLNRVGLLDILRATVLENSKSLNLVITTSSRALARHLIEKFSGVGPIETPSGLSDPLRVIELDGNGRSGVALQTIYPLG
ncbi:AAA family ATPase [Sphingobium yanoikuyae]|uniref:AAA family ATPase n=1 Tax=Sphingobium yanoikuyae TaxID=13690 RepID=UPI000847C789|nr:AAA family ATPase [Sphingobium yanoikuyae]